MMCVGVGTRGYRSSKRCVPRIIIGEKGGREEAKKGGGAGFYSSLDRERTEEEPYVSSSQRELWPS